MGEDGLGMGDVGYECWSLFVRSFPSLFPGWEGQTLMKKGRNAQDVPPSVPRRCSTSIPCPHARIQLVSRLQPIPTSRFRQASLSCTSFRLLPFPSPPR